MRPPRRDRCLYRCARVVDALLAPAQVYVCLWSHAGGEPVHIHYVVQPISRSQMDQFGVHGPRLQVAMFEAWQPPAEGEVGRFAERARAGIGALRHTRRIASGQATTTTDDERVRITTWTFQDGHDTGPHRHEYDYIVVPVTGGTFEVVARDGASRELTQESAQSYLGRAGTEHNVINRSGRQAVFVEIELKAF